MMNRDRRDGSKREAPLLKLAREFAAAAATYWSMRLHGPANDAEAWKGACETMARPADREAA